MNLTYLIASLLALSVGAATVAVTADDLAAIATRGHAQAQAAGSLNAYSQRQGAEILYLADHGTAPTSESQLWEGDKYLSRTALEQQLAIMGQAPAWAQEVLSNAGPLLNAAAAADQATQVQAPTQWMQDDQGRWIGLANEALCQSAQALAQYPNATCYQATDGAWILQIGA